MKCIMIRVETYSVPPNARQSRQWQMDTFNGVCSERIATLIAPQLQRPSIASAVSKWSVGRRVPIA